MSAGFTPGKWVAYRCGPAAPHRWNVTAKLGENERGIEMIRTIDQVLDYCGPAEAEANARLIASAPELYEALDTLTSLAKGLVGSAYINDAETALAKARGES